MEKIICCLFLAFCVLFLAVLPVQAAVLSFSPSSGTYAAGSNFGVSVYVSSPDQAMNAVSAAVSFPQDKLEITSLSKTGSIVNMWVQEPSFSNSDGSADLEGIIPNPGFTGAAGKIITINFKVKSAGTAAVSFSSGSVLANDGNGTDILKNSGSAQFTLVAAPVVTATPAPPKNNNPPPVVAPASSLPSAPQISSPTNPDPNKWYNNNNPKFTWPLTPDITSVKTLYNKTPASQPTVVYRPAVSETDITSNLKDGIYYFHAQLQNSAGWGPVSNFRFQIDTQPPAPFEIKLADGKETDNPRPVISFATSDALSGIDYYKIKINDSDFSVIPQEQITNGSYALPLQTPGQKQVFVMALDKAGNYEVAYVEFTVKSITPPVITDYPQVVENNEPLAVKGQSYPDSKIIIWLQGAGTPAENWTVESDSAGNFTFTNAENLQSGTYQLWAQVVDSRGAVSDNSDKKTITERRSVIFTVESWVTNNIITSLLCILLFFLLVILFITRSYDKKIAELTPPKKRP